MAAGALTIETSLSAPAAAPAVRVDAELSPNFSPEDLQFWHNNPPEKIVIPSGSVRKSFLALMLFNDLSFERTIDIKTPLELHQFLEREVANGDGELKENVYIDLF